MSETGGGLLRDGEPRHYRRPLRADGVTLDRRRRGEGVRSEATERKADK
jgi:hypothetical protein